MEKSIKNARSNRVTSRRVLIHDDTEVEKLWGEQFKRLLLLFPEHYGLKTNKNWRLMRSVGSMKILHNYHHLLTL